MNWLVDVALTSLLVVWAMHLVAASFTIVPTRQVAIMQRAFATLMVIAAFVLLEI